MFNMVSLPIPNSIYCDKDSTLFSPYRPLRPGLVPFKIAPAPETVDIPPPPPRVHAKSVPNNKATVIRFNALLRILRSGRDECEKQLVAARKAHADAELEYMTCVSSGQDPTHAKAEYKARKAQMTELAETLKKKESALDDTIKGSPIK